MFVLFCSPIQLIHAQSCSGGHQGDEEQADGAAEDREAEAGDGRRAGGRIRGRRLQHLLPRVRRRFVFVGEFVFC